MTADDKQFVIVELGVTLPYGGFGNIKPRISMSIDPYSDMPVEEQVKRAISTSAVAFAAIDSHFEAVISDLIAPLTGLPSVGDRVKELEKSRDAALSNFRKIAAKLKKMEEAIGIETSKAVVKHGETS